MSVSVSPYNPTQQSGVRAKRPPDLVIADRNPTTLDFGFFVGQLWVNLNNSYWGLVGKPINVANWVQFGITAPPGVQTLSINDLATTITPVGNNIDFANTGVPPGPAAGGLNFTSPGAGQINVGVNVDGTTVIINSSNQVQVADEYTGSVSTTAGGPDQTIISIPTTPNTFYYVRAEVIGGDVGSTTVLGGSNESIIHTVGAGAVVGSPNEYYAELPLGGTKDFIIILSGGNILVQAIADAVVGMNWRAKARIVAV